MASCSFSSLPIIHTLVQGQPYTETPLTDTTRQFFSLPSAQFRALGWWKKVIDIAKHFFISLSLAIRGAYHSLINRLKKNDSRELRQEEHSKIENQIGISQINSTSAKVSSSVPRDNRETKEEILHSAIKRADERPVYIAKSSTQNKYDYIGSSSFFKKFIAENPSDHFRQELQKLGNNNEQYHIIANLDYEQIELPNREALELQALKYAEKYRAHKLTIKVTDLNQLTTVLAELQRESLTPRYVGVIIEETAEGHVIPLLCYFGPKNTAHPHNEFLILDVLGSEDFTLPELLTSFVTNNRDIIQYHMGVRQADNYSCRTGALSLLCDALLSLNFYSHKNGFREALKDCNLRGQKTPISHISYIPEDWAAHEQLFEGEGTKLHIRDLVSNNPSKRAHPRTIKQVREGHRENVRMRYTIGPMALYPINEMSRFKGITPPLDVEVCFKTNRITFERVVRINTYLVRKARRRKNELSSASIPSPVVQ